MQGEFLEKLKNYSRIIGRDLVVSLNENQTIILVKKNGSLLIGETKEDVIRSEKGLEGFFGEELNLTPIELNIP